MSSVPDQTTPYGILKSIPPFFSTNEFSKLFPFFEPIALPIILTSPLTIPTTGLIEKTSPANAVTAEILPPFLRYFNVLSRNTAPLRHNTRQMDMRFSLPLRSGAGSFAQDKDTQNQERQSNQGALRTEVYNTRAVRLYYSLSLYAEGFPSACVL